MPDPQSTYLEILSGFNLNPAGARRSSSPGGDSHLNEARSRAGRTAHARDVIFPTCISRNYVTSGFVDRDGTIKLRRVKKKDTAPKKNLKLKKKRGDRKKNGVTLTGNVLSSSLSGQPQLER